jgi:hypothetical protein
MFPELLVLNCNSIVWLLESLRSDSMYFLEIKHVIYLRKSYLKFSPEWDIKMTSLCQTDPEGPYTFEKKGMYNCLWNNT